MTNVSRFIETKKDWKQCSICGERIKAGEHFFLYEVRASTFKKHVRVCTKCACQLAIELLRKNPSYKEQILEKGIGG